MPPLDTIFAPLLSPDRMVEYGPGDLVLANRADGSLDITFTPKESEDLDVFMPAPGLIFFLPAGIQTILPGGPTVTPTADALAVQVLNMDDVLAEIGPTSPHPATYAPWWVIEGIDGDSFIDFVKSDGQEERKQYEEKFYPNVQTFREGLLLGQTSFNVSCKDEHGVVVDEPIAIASLVGDPDEALTFRLVTYYGFGDPIQYELLPTASSLAAIALLQPALAPHPLVVQGGAALAGSDLVFHVKFQFWSPYEPAVPTAVTREVDKGTFQPMPPGTVVRLMKVSLADPDVRSELAAGALDADGMVEFTPGAAEPRAVPRASLHIDPANEVAAFLVEAPSAPFVTQYQRDGAPRATPTRLGWCSGLAEPWPEIWMTHGFTATTGQPGSLQGLETLPAASFGLPSAPVVYNVGIPVFLQIVHARLLSHARAYSTMDERSPKGVKVFVRNSHNVDLGAFRTDEHGQVWGLVTQWDPKDTNIRIIVSYEMEDRPAAGLYPLALPRITGSVPGAVPPIAKDHFDSGWEDHEAPVPGTTFGFSGPFSGASLGTTDGGVLAAGLQVVRIGSIRVNWGTYELVPGGKALLGEHGGLMDAFKTIRQAHEWWYQLTDNVGGLIADPTDPAEVALKTRWATLFDALHRPIGAAGLVVEVIANPDVTIRGGASVVHGTDRFQLKLYYPETWNKASPLDPTKPIGPGNQQLADMSLTLLWNRGVSHHEFAHIVFQVAAELNTNSGALANGLVAYNSQYEVRQVERDTFTPLLEGISNVLSLAVASSMRTFNGAKFVIDGATGTVQVDNFRGDPPPPFLLISDAVLRNDRRMGLWVPGAVARAFWDYLNGAAPRLFPIIDLVTAIPAPDKTDLRDQLASIHDAAVRRLFQRVLWLPMRALRTPDHPAAAEWDDGGVAGTKRAYPTTFSLLRHFANDPDCYPRLDPAGQQRARDIFGTGLATSWYLWDPWP